MLTKNRLFSDFKDYMSHNLSYKTLLGPLVRPSTFSVIPCPIRRILSYETLMGLLIEPSIMYNLKKDLVKTRSYLIYAIALIKISTAVIYPEYDC